MLSKDKIPRCKYYGGTSSRTILHRQSHSIPRLGCYGKHHNTYILLPFCILALLVVGWSMISPSTINVSHVVNAMESDGVYAEEGSIGSVESSGVDVEDVPSTYTNVHEEKEMTSEGESRDEGSSSSSPSTTTYGMDTPTSRAASPSAALTVSDTNLTTQTVPGEVAYLSSNITYSVNDIESYSLKISYASGSNALKGDSSSASTITGAGGKTPASMSSNTWGYALADTNANNTTLTYNTMPAYGSGTTIVSGNAESVPTTTKKLVFAAKFSNDAKAGHYQARVMLSMVATPKALLFAGIDNMQQMTTQICKDAKIGDTTTLKDTRDNSTYTIRKHEDGNCWMTENLRLTTQSLATAGHSATLTDIDTDVDSFTMPETVIGSGTTVEWQNKSYEPATATFNNVTNGTYYNWSAAVAEANTSGITSGDAPWSICPKGWKLPPNSGNGSYTNFTSAAGITNSADGSNKIRSAPYNFPYAGDVRDSSLNVVGSYGNYWSRTVDSSNSQYAYRLVFLSSNVLPADSYFRYYGFSIRCVATS